MSAYSNNVYMTKTRSGMLTFNFYHDNQVIGSEGVVGERWRAGAIVMVYEDARKFCDELDGILKLKIKEQVSGEEVDKGGDQTPGGITADSQANGVSEGI